MWIPPIICRYRWILLGCNETKMWKKIALCSLLFGNIMGMFMRFGQFNSFLASGDFCCLLITFANNLDPDQAWHAYCLTLLGYSWKIFFEKVNFKNKIHRWPKSLQNYPACKELTFSESTKCLRKKHNWEHSSINQPNWSVTLTFIFTVHQDRSTVQFRHYSQKILHTMWDRYSLIYTGDVCLCILHFYQNVILVGQ